MALLEITNTKFKTGKKRLSDGTVKNYYYNIVRKQLELYFQNESEKLMFSDKLQEARGISGLKTTALISKLLTDYVLQHEHSDLKDLPSNSVPISSIESSLNLPKTEQSTGAATFPYFVGATSTTATLLSTIQLHSRHCPLPLSIHKFAHNGHVLECTFICNNGHTESWFSSPVLGNNYQVNYKMFCASLCSGMLTSQYKRFSKCAEMGSVTDHFHKVQINKVADVINTLKKESITTALQEEAEESQEAGMAGIGVMTDARHACRKNSYHTDHVTLGQKVHKVIDMQHITKARDNCTQRHERIGCEEMYNAMEEAGINIVEHAHDRNMSVNKDVKSRDNVKNFNDRWHAAKGVVSGIRSVSCGTKKTKDKTWHPDLKDKGAALRNHVYASMDMCNGSADTLKRILLSACRHFQGDHSDCSLHSDCREPGYVLSVKRLTDPISVSILETFIRKLTVFKYAQDYICPRDTNYVESFNNVCLLYLDKRIHYKDVTYNLRMGLAVLDWNEHVDRPFTSRYNKVQVTHPRRNCGKKTYTTKTYSMWTSIWERLVQKVITAYAGNNPQDSDTDDSDDDNDDCQMD